MRAVVPRRPVLILGGGLAGVSSAFHLRNTPHVLVEREGTVGGTARSFLVDGFTFDITGHLLHLHNPYTKRLIPKLLNNQIYSCVRKAWIFSKGAYTKYPFQACTRGLPDDVVDACVLGFFEAYQKSKTAPPSMDMDFRSWCYRMFGAGIAENFMIPYNQKLYQTRAEKMTTEWCGTFVPMPALSDVIQGALADRGKNFGYNTTFFYPKRGGIQGLAEAMSQQSGNIYLNTSIKKLDWRRKRATLSNAETVTYDRLINTIPLLELLKLMGPLPAPIKSAAKQLKYASIICMNLGVKRPRISEASWIYFPEQQYPFYRVGFPMNFTPHVVPKGCSSMYVEIPMRYAKNISKRELYQRVRHGLIEAKILKPADKVPVVQIIPVKYAYVIYDRARRKALKKIFSFLSKQGILSIGRYGAWKYSFMEEAILDGKKAAERVRNDRSN